MVYFLEADWVRFAFDGNEAGGEDSSVLVAFDERVYGVSIGGDRGTFQIPCVVLEDCWIPYSLGASLQCLFVGPVDIFHPKSNVRDSVCVCQNKSGYRMVWDKGEVRKEANIALCMRKGGLVFNSSFGL